MCGIVGVIGRGNGIVPAIVDGLKRLEYRGYDSAGVAVATEAGLARRRAAGKLSQLEAVLAEDPIDGAIGIGHTRWATHGAPTTNNAHPHATEKVAIVHNGIIENFASLRTELEGHGKVFATETDSETIAQLITHFLDEGASPREAFGKTMKRLDGAYAIAAVFAEDLETLYASRMGSPLAVGRGEGAAYLGSDAYALAPFTNKVTYLSDGDWAVVSRDRLEIFDAADAPVLRDEKTSDASAALVDKGEHRHFMAKEIHEQPEVIAHTLSAYIDTAAGAPRPQPEGLDFARAGGITISACGTAYYAGLVAKYWFERWARLPVEIDIASELRYRDPPYREGGVALFISQSGETADTLAAMRHAKENGQTTVAIVNVPESTIAREADIALPTHAGPEIGVASTKAFTCQLTALAGVALTAAAARGTLSEERLSGLVRGLMETPRRVANALHLGEEIEAISHELAKARDILYLGRGVAFPIAMEGALKLKEISYIHAEGYAAGELKHGPIALIDENVPVVVIAPHDDLFEKTVSNMQEVMARGGRTVLITDARGAAAAPEAWKRIITPEAEPDLAPILHAIPVQLLAYHVAVAKGTDVDQPRNLAKSVTVE